MNSAAKKVYIQCNNCDTVAFAPIDMKKHTVLQEAYSYGWRKYSTGTYLCPKCSKLY